MASVYFFSKRDLDLSISSSFLKEKKTLSELYLYIETDSASLQGDIIYSGKYLKPSLASIKIKS